VNHCTESNEPTGLIKVGEINIIQSIPTDNTQFLSSDREHQYIDAAWFRSMHI